VEKETELIHLSAAEAAWAGLVNPPVCHASTVVFRTLEEFRSYHGGPYPKSGYGRFGTATAQALEAALARLDGADRALVLSSGLAAIVHALLAFVGNGDHVLMVDSVYNSTRQFCKDELTRLGITVTYYDPTDRDALAAAMRDNTRVVYVESPGSLTFEMQDVCAIAAIAHARGAVVIADNTWATPLYYRPFEHGIDVSIHAATKYLAGHSDVMLGAMTCREAHWPALVRIFNNLGACAGPDDCYLALRGLRTLAVRLRQHHATSVQLARWLRQRPEVERVIHPALPEDVGHALWRRDMPGAGGVFAVLLRPVAQPALAAMLDGMELFRMGYSWGGYESLMIPVYPEKVRTRPRWPHDGPTLRIHAGLEHVDDLIRDLERGFARLKATTTAKCFRLAATRSGARGHAHALRCASRLTDRSHSVASRLQIAQAVVHSCPGLRGHLEHCDARPHRLDAALGGGAIKLDGSRQVDLRDDRHVGGVEDCRVLERLVFPLGHREQHQSQVLAQVERGRADEIADVLDEQEIEGIQVPTVQRALDHRGVEMAHRPRRDLLDRNLAARQTSRVIVGRQVADQRGHAIATAQGSQHALKESGLARTGTRHETDDEHARSAETFAQRPGRDVVLLEHTLPDFHQARVAVHDSTSSARTSNSRPLRISGVALPHVGQYSICGDSSVRGAAHVTQ
jgi:cystathionine beta-lyase